MYLLRVATVAPFVGAWIEILVDISIIYCCAVAPFVGAWIEILLCVSLLADLHGRSVRRSVD